MYPVKLEKLMFRHVIENKPGKVCTLGTFVKHNISPMGIGLLPLELEMGVPAAHEIISVTGVLCMDLVQVKLEF
jgi:hypothetical protein